MKEGWDYKELGECCDILDSKRKPITKNKRILGDIPYYGATGILDYVKDYIFDEKLVLIGEDGAKWGAGENTAYIIDGKSWVNNHAHAIRPNRQCIIDEFLVFYLNYSDLSDKITGVTVPKLNQEKMRGIILPVPSLSEQQQIVSFLDSEFEKIDALKANAETQLQAAKDLFQKALKEMLTPKEGWEEKKLNEIALYYNGLTYKPTDVSKHGFLVLRSSNIQNNLLSLKDQVRVSVEVNDKLKIHKGDIIMCSRNGSKALIGKVAIIPEEYDDFTFGTFMMVIKSKYNPLLYYFFLSERFKGQIWKGEANMINQITRYMLDDVLVCLPSNIEEQKKIVDNLDTLSAKVKQLEKNYNETITLCNDLKQSLLKKIFE